jgi:hypothetical protein
MSMRDKWQPSLKHPSVAHVQVTLAGTMAGGDRYEDRVLAPDVVKALRDLYDTFVQIDTVIAPKDINMTQVLLTHAARIGRPVVHRGIEPSDPDTWYGGRPPAQNQRKENAACSYEYEMEIVRQTIKFWWGSTGRNPHVAEDGTRYGRNENGEPILIGPHFDPAFLDFIRENSDPGCSFMQFIEEGIEDKEIAA